MTQSTHLRVCYGLIAILFCTVAFHLNQGSAPPPTTESTAGSETRSEFEPLIDSLRSRNQTPAIVRIKGGKETMPFIPSWYGWDEQQRVYGAVAAVLKSPTDRLLRPIIAHKDDKLYSFTLMNRYADSASGTWSVARNWSVGDFCRSVASYHLAYPAAEATRSLQVGAMKSPLPFAFDNAERILDEIGPADLRDFWQLQVEVCRRTISDLPSAKYRASGDFFTDSILKSCHKELDNTISRLEGKKSGIFGNYEFPFGESRYYQEADIAQIMQLLRSANPTSIEWEPYED